MYARARRRTLAVMAKAPAAGLVKTRLARQIGTSEALRCYRAMLHSLLRRVGHDPRWRTVLHVAPEQALNAGFWPPGMALRAQAGRDLGARMQHILATAPPGPVVIVGCDIPGVTATRIEAAFRALGRNDMVFGPAADGGFWLVGASRRGREPDVFAGVRWSSPHALADTLANAHDLSVALVDRLEDVDDAAAYRRWKAGLIG